MKYEIYSYRYAQEIIEHPKHESALDEILDVIKECPLFVFPNKSSKNTKLSVVQQLLNTFFDRRFACDLKWEYHPTATAISNSDLKADFRKDFGGLRIQTEIQFGNMARWYSDIFKFQTAYSQGMVDLGLCIVPNIQLAKMIDSNVTNFERCVRELPSAKLSITIPILVIGISSEKDTEIVDVSQSKFSKIADPKGGTFTGKGSFSNRYRIVNAFLKKEPISSVTDISETGPMTSQEITSPDEI